MVGLGHGAIWAALIFGALILLVMVATLLQRRTMARGRDTAKTRVLVSKLIVQSRFFNYHVVASNYRPLGVFCLSWCDSRGFSIVCNDGICIGCIVLASDGRHA
ncbi:hypothetical protein HMPREF3172_05975 [Brevibacterium sp. HMSC08F02]|nr:hypothetical protein HMPREF3172_05975 [Brevibacterium sp. HMSC08F02]